MEKLLQEILDTVSKPIITYLKTLPGLTIKDYLNQGQINLKSFANVGININEETIDLNKFSKLGIEKILNIGRHTFHFLHELNPEYPLLFDEEFTYFVNLLVKKQNFKYKTELDRVLYSKDRGRQQIKLLLGIGDMFLSKEDIYNAGKYFNKAKLKIDNSTKDNREIFTTWFQIGMGQIDVIKIVDRIIEEDKINAISDIESQIPMLLKSIKTKENRYETVLADLYLFTEDFNKARLVLNRDKEIDERELAKVDLLQNNPQPFIAHYTKELNNSRQDPRTDAFFKLNLAMGHYFSGNYKPIINLEDKIIQVNPNKRIMIKLNYCRGNAFIETQDIQKAKLYLKKSVKDFLGINPIKNKYNLRFNVFYEIPKYALKSEVALNQLLKRRNNNQVLNRIKKYKLMMPSRIEAIVNENR